ncbi:MAG TPA: tRNA (adenosine(37)-N6)-threonylcarbamoyltransferase complex ATPase subunit type 1 TsaE [Patescibacteria group bacterium]|nr:tRNA (adenosine(37)-N6)-threonylcarbamoyltransferase complex ATPase subunit type 1 TsaE [Patescibacteria group bacterium]
MEEERFVSENAASTQKLGEELAQSLKPGDIISLTGNLGAGKTTFVQGLAKGLGIEERIISPTFVLVRQHNIHPKTQDLGSNIKTLYHIDLYRLEGEESIKNIGLEEFLNDPNAVSVIEWAKKHPGLRPNIEIEIENEDDKRVIKIKK